MSVKRWELEEIEDIIKADELHHHKVTQLYEMLESLGFIRDQIRKAAKTIQSTILSKEGK